MNPSIYKLFDNKVILITGATGFIGGRLVELLVQNSSVRIKVLVRDYGKAMRISRFNLEIVKGDVNDLESLNRAVSGCDIVFHCAYGNKGDQKTRRKINEEGTHNLLSASKEKGVKSFVFLSTVSVYGISSHGVLDETCDAKPDSNDSYAVSKYIAEQEVLKFAKKNNFHATVIQPTAVYGPWSPSYVVSQIANLNRFKMPLINGGIGICNAVYVDDLCQAVLLAAVQSNAAGQKYLINGKEHFTWKEYYESIGNLIKDPEFATVTEKEMHALYKQQMNQKTFLKTTLKLFTLNLDAAKELLQYKFFFTMVNLTIYRLPDSILKKIKASLAKKKVGVSTSKSIMVMNPYFTSFFASKRVVNSEKAIRELGYTPEFDKRTSFASIQKWVEWYY